MKKLILLLLILSLQSCWYIGGGEPLPPPSRYTAVFMDRTEFENSIAIEDAKTVIDAGKIYTFNDYLYISEKYEGFHIYNNSNPVNPLALKFLKVPGSTDMAIKNNIIYINQSRDLIAVQIDPITQQISVTKRIRNVFPIIYSPDGFYPNTPEGKVLIKWVLN